MNATNARTVRLDRWIGPAAGITTGSVRRACAGRGVALESRYSLLWHNLDAVDRRAGIGVCRSAERRRDRKPGNIGDGGDHIVAGHFGAGHGHILADEVD